MNEFSIEELDEIILAVSTRMLIILYKNTNTPDRSLSIIKNQKIYAKLNALYLKKQEEQK